MVTSPARAMALPSSTRTHKKKTSTAPHIQPARRFRDSRKKTDDYDGIKHHHSERGYKMTVSLDSDFEVPTRYWFRCNQGWCYKETGPKVLKSDLWFSSIHNLLAWKAEHTEQ